MQDARGFVENTLVKVPYGGRAVFFRLLAIDLERNALTVRMERFTLFWQTTDIAIGKGTPLRFVSEGLLRAGVREQTS